jgi:tetratricopeptide (TPR) repeat protein
VTRSWRYALLLTAISVTPLFSQTTSKHPADKETKPAQPSSNQAPGSQLPPSEDLPPEEDHSEAPTTYVFNPLESERNIKIGNFYMHQGTPRGYRAAAGRYSDATKYNPTSPEAFFKLGEAEEKLKNKDAAKSAFQRVVQVAPDSKLAREAKKKLSGKS